MPPQEGMTSYSQGDLQRMIRQVSDLYTQTAEATAKELEDASSLSEAGGENFKVSSSNTNCRILQIATFVQYGNSFTSTGSDQGQASSAKRATWYQTL